MLPAAETHQKALKYNLFLSRGYLFVNPGDILIYPSQLIRSSQLPIVS